jgi:hypothetical protein
MPLRRRDFLAAAGAVPLPAAPAPLRPIAIAKAGAYSGDLGGLASQVSNRTVTVKRNLTGSPSFQWEGNPPALTRYSHPRMAGGIAALFHRAGIGPPSEGRAAGCAGVCCVGETQSARTAPAERDPGCRIPRINSGWNTLCTGAVGAAVLGYNPMADKGSAPFEKCDNTILIAERLGLGSADLDAIPVLGAQVRKARFDFPNA